MINTLVLNRNIGTVCFFFCILIIRSATEHALTYHIVTSLGNLYYTRLPEEQIKFVKPVLNTLHGGWFCILYIPLQSHLTLS